MKNPLTKRKHDSRDLVLKLYARRTGTPAVSENKIFGSGQGSKSLLDNIEAGDKTFNGLSRLDHEVACCKA